MTIHKPYPVMVYTGDLDDNGHPDLESEAVEVQIRCACTHSLSFDYGHHVGLTPEGQALLDIAGTGPGIITLDELDE